MYHSSGTQNLCLSSCRHVQYSMEGARGRREESNFILQEVASDRAEVKYEILHLAQLLLRPGLHGSFGLEGQRPRPTCIIPLAADKTWALSGGLAFLSLEEQRPLSSLQLFLLPSFLLPSIRRPTTGNVSKSVLSRRGKEVDRQRARAGGLPWSTCHPCLAEITQRPL